jgi:hypothetical protein
MLRWQVLPQKPGLPEPAVHCEMVKRKDLAAALPATTVMYDREQRESQLKLREAGFARRFTER